jgi:hypothetical protein
MHAMNRNERGQTSLPLRCGTWRPPKQAENEILKALAELLIQIVGPEPTRREEEGGADEHGV